MFVSLFSFSLTYIKSLKNKMIVVRFILGGSVPNKDGFRSQNGWTHILPLTNICALSSDFDIALSPYCDFDENAI